MSAALVDLGLGVVSVHVWGALAWSEIKQRYRRSVIGPFWLTISAGALIGAMGPLYGSLLKQPLADYFPYLAVGFIIWQFMASVLVESCQAFIVAEGFIKQTRLPLSVHVLRVVFRNLIVFAHNFVVIIAVIVLMGVPISWHLALFPIGLAILILNAVWVGLILGTVSARFRDVPQIVASVVQVALFLTPIMWKPSMLKESRWIADFNPLFHLLEIVRAPLLGYMPDTNTLFVVGAITLTGWAMAFSIYARLRSRIAFWV